MDIVVDGSGLLSWSNAAGVDHAVRCTVGRGGIGQKKAEGDGITPVGRFPLRGVMARPERIAVIQTALPVSPITKTDGWCDDPASADYNRRITLPHPASHEQLWRADALYDVIIEIGYNDDPVVPGRGSAIFIHVARARYQPTQGCVALKLDDLLELLKACDENTRLVVK